MRELAALALLSAFILAPTSSLRAAPPLPAPAKVVLKGGHVLTGTVVRTVQLEGKTYSVVQTDFGEILAPQREITEITPAVATVDTFLADEVRIVRLTGLVERRVAGGAEWTRVVSPDPAYTGQNRPRLEPGDTVRTGTDGHLDLMLHRDAWVRLEPGTEVEISTVPERGSLQLLRGVTVQDVTGRPRGQTFRVGTPSTTLGVRGTRFAAFVDGENQGVAVLRGVVRVGTASDVGAGEEAGWTDPVTVTVSPLSDDRRRVLDVAVHRTPIDEMVLVPGGSYPIGPPGRAVPGTSLEGWSLAAHFDSLPGDGGPKAPHPFLITSSFETSGSIEVKAFLIDLREVAQDEFAAFLAAERGADDKVAVSQSRAREPAVVAHSEAEAFARWAGKALPTATQWQIAARGGDSRVFPWGTTVKPRHRDLVLGTWQKDGVSGSWTPPPTLPDVDAPTLDVSPFGIRGALSSAPEWTRSLIDREPIWPLLSRNFRMVVLHRDYRPDGLVCGWGSSLFAIRVGHGEERVGLRCMVELEGRR